MRSLHITAAARADLRAIQTHTEQKFGPAARARYAVLLAQALRDLSENPLRPGSLKRPEIGPDLLTYHISFSKNRSRSTYGAVRTPRHLILYMLEGDSILAILRVLHDGMDIRRHVPTTPRRR
ncbi:hypothetical protein VZ95_15200 [Elstera litoralis]|uniref:Plasmid stabilization protein ParE n=1 Tax=Elstera litoralis TaxID=552518 RepID=A0A0F3IQ08_9PROT|nr:type II toxin-antitoxin system RelE/ParE family toxin [Elstera litoralis]KJV08840.1 hypothetical protein VZ95_15200 [Elstera litoralis]